MRFAIRYICIFASLLISCSCDLEELKLNNPSESTIDFIARPADYNNVDVATKSEPTDEFETEIHTAYLLLFDANNNRIYFSEVDPQSRLQRVTLKGLSTVTACFVANVAKADIEGITTLDALNSAVLNLNYATYSEAGGHLGVPKLAVNGTYELCFPMVGVKTLDVSQISQAIEIPLTRLFAKVSVELKMNISSLPSYDRTRFELNSYRLVNLPLKVSLLHQDKESSWVKESGSFAGENSHVVSNIQYKIFNNSYNLAGDQQKKYTFNIYVPEYQLESLPSTTPNYGKQEYKPKMYDSLNKKAVHIVLKGSYIPSSGSSTDLDYSVFLGENESTNFTMNRNVHYTNLLTITGIQKNADNTDEALIDHRVKMSDGDMVSMFGEVANCYLISKEGEYSFPAYKGAFKADVLSKEYLCNGNRAEILYKSSETDIVFDDEDGDGNPINVKTDADGTKVIEFKLSKVSADGNVIIAMYDDNRNIEWSWHMWFVTGLQLGGNKTGYFELGTQTLPNGKKMTDRNLGVTANGLENLASGTLTGLYYKYGHKDPYLNQTYLGGGECTEYDWGSNYKSRTDPCPPGYRVPSSDVWKGFTPTNEHSRTPNAFIFWKENTGDLNLSDDIYVYYPYSGYLENGSSHTSKIVPTPLEYNETILYEVTTGLINVYRAYTNIKYTVNVTTTFGILCGSDQTMEYQMVTKDSGNWFESDFTVTEVTWYKGERVRVGGSLFNPVYEIQYDYSKPYTLADISRTEQVNWGTAKSTVIDPKLEAATKDLSYKKILFGSPNKEWGYQIRCVAE